MTDRNGQEAAGLRADYQAHTVLVVALKHLVNSMNPAAKLHPFDRAGTIELFRSIHDGGIPLSPDEVDVWFTETLRWPADLVREIALIAERVLAGKSFRGVPKDPYWEKDIVEQ